MKRAIYLRLPSEDGQTMAEYAIVMSVMIVGMLVALAVLVPSIRDRIIAVTGLIA